MSAIGRCGAPFALWKMGEWDELWVELFSMDVLDRSLEVGPYLVVFGLGASA